MKTGVYIDGLGQSMAKESATKYATRLMNEFIKHKTGVAYNLKIEKIKYTNDTESNVISIIEREGTTEKIAYKLYEFKYSDILTGEFNKQNILIKNMKLFGVVVKKMPVLMRRLFNSKGYNRPFQTFYLFALFFIIAAAILFMVPAIISVLSNFMASEEVIKFTHHFPWLLEKVKQLGITREWVNHFSEKFVSIIAIALLIVPQANTIISSLATEFVCAHYYLEFGEQKQNILGNLDMLVEYIVENEENAEIHFHAYSFGSIVVLDYLLPFGEKPSGNMLERTKALITIGTPFEFVNSYYPNHFEERSAEMEKIICWINVYSVADAMASNFRKNVDIGDAEYGITMDGMKPTNLNYELFKLNNYNIINFLSLKSIQVHGMYWGSNTDAKSCLSLIFIEMRKQNLIPV